VIALANNIRNNSENPPNSENISEKSFLELTYGDYEVIVKKYCLGPFELKHRHWDEKQVIIHLSSFSFFFFWVEIDTFDRPKMV